METCPRCDRRVEQVHVLPPEVVTRGLIEDFGGVDVLTDLEACSDCLDELLHGKRTT